MKLNLLLLFFIVEKKLTAFLFCLILFTATSVFSHGDLSKRIETLSQEIKKTPEDSELYLERGFLYQQHLEFDKALQDYSNAENLGLNTKQLQFRKAETYFLKEDFKAAYTTSEICLEFDIKDVKTQKLQAKILIGLGKLHEALAAYDFVVKNTQDIKPEDIIAYSDLILNINPSNYSEAIKAIDLGLNKLGEDTFSLQLKKLDYFKSDNQEENTINQFNYFILNNNRKEFWYFKKADYLIKINKPNEARVALKQSQLAIQQLDKRFQEMKSIKNLITKLENLENQLSNEK
jgi:predicted Zn-dependent protease